MPLQQTLEKVGALYSDGLRKHGVNPQAVGWRDEDSQSLRFDKLLTVIRKDSSSVVINELGCGYCALLPHLLDRGVNVGKFRGYDISLDMLNAAREVYPSNVLELRHSAIIDSKADYSIASGIFNVKFDTPDEIWRVHVEQTLDNMSEMSEIGFAFNMLTNFVDWKEPHLFYGDPCYFFDLCKKKFGRFVSLLHDTHLYEWTITVRKAA